MDNEVVKDILGGIFIMGLLYVLTVLTFCL